MGTVYGPGIKVELIACESSTWASILSLQHQYFLFGLDYYQLSFKYPEICRKIKERVVFPNNLAQNVFFLSSDLETWLRRTILSVTKSIGCQPNSLSFPDHASKMLIYSILNGPRPWDELCLVWRPEQSIPFLSGIQLISIMYKTQFLSVDCWEQGAKAEGVLLKEKSLLVFSPVLYTANADVLW